jgi:hypothetical protein
LFHQRPHDLRSSFVTGVIESALQTEMQLVSIQAAKGILHPLHASDVLPPHD